MMKTSIEYIAQAVAAKCGGELSHVVYAALVACRMSENDVVLFGTNCAETLKRMQKQHAQGEEHYTIR